MCSYVHQTQVPLLIVVVGTYVVILDFFNFLQVKFNALKRNFLQSLRSIDGHFYAHISMIYIITHMREL